MKKVLFSFSVILAFTLSSCGDDSWSDANKTKLVEDCASKGMPEAACKCMLDKIAEKYSSVSEAKKAMEEDKEVAMKMAMECI